MGYLCADIVSVPVAALRASGSPTPGRLLHFAGKRGPVSSDRLLWATE